MLFIIVALFCSNPTIAASEDFFCETIQIIKDGITVDETSITQWEGIMEKYTDERNSLKSMLEYLNTFDEASACNGSQIIAEEDDFFSCIQTVEEDIQSSEKNIQGAENFIEKHNTELTKRKSQLQFLNTFDLAQSCEYV